MRVVPGVSALPCSLPETDCALKATVRARPNR